MLQPPGIEPGSVLHRNEASPSVRHSRVRVVCGRHERNGESRLSTSRGLVHVPPAYCSCENRERVDDFRRQEFHILGYPTSDRSACAILLRDNAIVLAGRYSTTRPWLPNVWTCFPDETKWDRDVYVHRVCTPLLSVMGRMGRGPKDVRRMRRCDARRRRVTSTWPPSRWACPRA